MLMFLQRLKCLLLLLILLLLNISCGSFYSVAFWWHLCKVLGGILGGPALTLRSPALWEAGPEWPDGLMFSTEAPIREFSLGDLALKCGPQIQRVFLKAPRRLDRPDRG